jgi:1,4-dihydroxy-2-naphthoyl-CoA hydrolase
MTDATTDELTAFMHASMPFTRLLGVTAVSASPDEVRTTIAWDETLCTAGGVLHGGALMSLADATGGWCAFFNLPPGTTTSTIESSTHFLRPVMSGRVEALARPVHVGRSVVVVDTELRDEAGRLVARVTQTQAVRPGPTSGSGDAEDAVRR